MSKKVFISYCHRQGEWVWDRLVPCLRYGGADALIDRERFKAGFSVIKQMKVVEIEELNKAPLPEKTNKSTIRDTPYLRWRMDIFNKLTVGWRASYSSSQ